MFKLRLISTKKQDLQSFSTNPVLMVKVFVLAIPSMVLMLVLVF